ncbi:MAG TPA: thiol reductant ABC exporter subunit CydC [Devosiaceae bacterium]|jgi:ATP-binding cassette subfamily C protein CydC|nr:thiol reductant ABC exporter subunit CydC [Devosiaceae bacterium]
MTALLSFAPLLARHKGELLRALALSVMTLFTGIALLGLSGWFLTAAAITTLGVAFDLFAPSAGVRGLSFLRILSRYGEKVAGHDVTLRLLSDIRQWTFARLFAPAAPVPSLSRADLVNRLVADVDALDNAALTVLGPVTSAIAIGIAMSLGLATLLPGAALAYGICFALAALVLPACFIALSRRPGAAVVAATGDLRQAVLDGIDGHRDLVVFGATACARAALDEAARRLAGARRRLGLLGALATAATQFVAGLAALLVLTNGLWALAAGRMEGPVLAALVLAVVASFEAVAPLVRSTARLGAAAAAAERLAALGRADTAPASAGSVVPPHGGTIDLDAVTFGYDPARPVLDRVSLHVAAGERIAIVGPSGAGKSTIAHLLVCLAEPGSGTIRLNAVPLRDVPVDVLRRRVALMTQDAPVFNDSIRDNLRIARPEADDSQLWAALEMAGLAGFVRGLPHGLDTIVGEAGATLSGGEARRLALARTLLAPADVLILDEPTSGLDRANELAFLRQLGDLRDGRTVILITHAALPEGVVDRIYRLSGGSLAEA